MTSNTVQIADSSLDAFYKAEPGFDVRQFEFHNPDAVAQLQARLGTAGVAEASIASKVAELKTYQRLLNLHPDLHVAQALMGRGIVSANHLARIPLKSFVAEHAAPLGLDAQEAQSLHRRAMGVRNSSMHLWASVNGAVASSYFRNSGMDTVSAQLKQTFQNLPSYQDMFGSLDYCDCPECRSIFGPAAYLVDLLRIIDQYVTAPNTATIAPEFLFTARRPDIWQIGLTCGNATTPVPYLQIVNERLLARAALVTGADVLQQMATNLRYPQALPFNAPLDQIRVLLDKVGVRYGDILSAWKASPSTVAAQSLGLSPDHQSIVTTALTTNAQIAPY